MIENYPLYWPEGRPRTLGYNRVRGVFKATFGAARDGLITELDRMGARNIILSTNIPVKNDGLPYASAKEPADSGAAVYFEYKKKPMCFACDKYVLVRDNLRAIEKTIDAIRGIERWGSSDMMERAFRGFTALPEQGQQSWREILEITQPKPSVDDIETAFRKLVHLHHPDKGGDAEKFHQIVLARENARKDLGISR